MSNVWKQWRFSFLCATQYVRLCCAWYRDSFEITERFSRYSFDILGAYRNIVFGWSHWFILSTHNLFNTPIESVSVSWFHLWGPKFASLFIYFSFVFLHIWWKYLLSTDLVLKMLSSMCVILDYFLLFILSIQPDLVFVLSNPKNIYQSNNTFNVLQSYLFVCKDFI